MLRPAPRVRPETTLATRRRRLPEAVALTEKSEPEFRQFVRDFEGHPLFCALHQRGLIAKVGLKGRIPKEKYDEYLDVRIVRLIREHKISDVPGWFDELSTLEAIQSPQRYASKYGADPGVLKQVARYCRRLRFNDGGDYPEHTPAGSALDPETARGGVSFDETEAEQLCADFVRRYNVDAQAFVGEFLHGNARPEALAARWGAGAAEVRRVLAAVESMRIFEVFAGSTKRAPQAGAGTAAPPAVWDLSVVGVIERNPGTGLPVLLVDTDDIYAQSYRIDPQGIEALYEIAGNEREAEALLSRLRLINQRKSLLQRLLSTLFRLQFRYFATGGEFELRPLSQAELARELGEDESTVSRLIRGKALRYQDGEVSLQWLCQNKRDVIRRLLARSPELSDVQVARELKARFGCSIGRRTVNYHRAQLDRAPAREQEGERRERTPPPRTDGDG